MTRRLLALCFGSPVNAGHADGISPAEASVLSVYNNCCILLSRSPAQKTTGLRGRISEEPWSVLERDQSLPWNFKWGKSTFFFFFFLLSQTCWNDQQRPQMWKAVNGGAILNVLHGSSSGSTVTQLVCSSLEQLGSINWHPGESHVEAGESTIQLGRLCWDWRYYGYPWPD